MEEQNTVEETKRSDKFIEYLVYTVVIISVIIIGVLLSSYIETGHLKGNDIDNDYLSAFGDFVGGVIGVILGLVTIILVFKTFKSQKEELSLSRDLIRRQSFENTFFKMSESLSQARNNIVLYNYVINQTNGEHRYTQEFRGPLFFENQKIEIKKNNFFRAFRNNPDFTGNNTTDQIESFIDNNSEFSSKYLRGENYRSLNTNQKEKIKLLATYYYYLKKNSYLLDSYFHTIATIIHFIKHSGLKQIQEDFYYGCLLSQLSSAELFHIYHYCLLSEQFRTTILLSNILERLYLEDLLSKEVHLFYYENDIKLAETPLVFM